MADNRERKVRESVPCPKCRAKVGEYCIGNGVDIGSHMERRRAWQAQRGEVQDKGLASPVCARMARSHGSERTGEFGCEKCDCQRAREQVRAKGGHT
jgi:hypothetical protein